MRKLPIILFFITALMVSCKKKVYHSFTDDERAYLVYDIGEIFKLRDENTGDTLTFQVTEKYIRYKKDYGPKLGPSRKEHFMEEGEVTFSGTNNSTSGYIYIYKDKIDQFSLDIRFADVTKYSFDASGESSPDDVLDININGINYTGVCRFNDIFISKEYGFVKMDHSVLDVTLTRIP